MQLFFQQLLMINKFYLKASSISARLKPNFNDETTGNKSYYSGKYWGRSNAGRANLSIKVLPNLVLFDEASLHHPDSDLGPTCTEDQGCQNSLTLNIPKYLKRMWEANFTSWNWKCLQYSKVSDTLTKWVRYPVLEISNRWTMSVMSSFLTKLNKYQHNVQRSSKEQGAPRNIAPQYLWSGFHWLSFSTLFGFLD